MTTRRVGIKFCGGCNPRIDRGRIAKEVARLLDPAGIEVLYSLETAQFAIFLSGCTANCANKYDANNIPSVVVADKTINSLAIEEEEIVDEIVMKVRSYFEQLERCI